jgi:HPt (histidine-containing phosphotransfer) domain-containing protein
VAAIGAASILKFSTVGLGLGVVSGIGVFYGLHLLLSDSSDITDDMRAQHASYKLQKLVKEGLKKGAHIRSLASNIPYTSPMNKEIQDIAQSVDLIFNNLMDDPNDVHDAEGFISYHLDKSIGIIEDYVRLSGKAHLMNASQLENLHLTEDAIREINASFAKQYQELLANDFHDLRNAAASLKTVLAMERPSGLPDIAAPSAPLQDLPIEGQGDQTTTSVKENDKTPTHTP